MGKHLSTVTCTSPQRCHPIKATDQGEELAEGRRLRTQRLSFLGQNSVPAAHCLVFWGSREFFWGHDTLQVLRMSSFFFKQMLDRVTHFSGQEEPPQGKADLLQELTVIQGEQSQELQRGSPLPLSLSGTPQSPNPPAPSSAVPIVASEARACAGPALRAAEGPASWRAA